MARRRGGSKSKRAEKTSTKKARAKKSKIDRLDVDDDAKAILKAMEKIGKPARCGEIAEIAGMSVQKVAGKMRSLVRRGFAKRSKEGLYSISI